MQISKRLCRDTESKPIICSLVSMADEIRNPPFSDQTKTELGCAEEDFCELFTFSVHPHWLWINSLSLTLIFSLLRPPYYSPQSIAKKNINCKMYFKNRNTF